jgi:hypothetical protein
VVPTSKVVEDGLEAPRRRADLSRWRWLASGALIGAGLLVIFGVGEGSLPTETTGAEGTGGIGEVVEGFPDALIGTTRSNGRSLALVTWPRTAPFHESSVTVGTSDQATPVAFDASGRMLATVLRLEDSPPGAAGGVLYAGVPDRAAIMDFAVTGFAWHDTSPAALAYTTFVDDELLLWTAGGSLADNDGSLPESTLVARAVGIEGGVVGWGDWGFVVRDDDSMVLLTETGEITGTYPGRFLASSGDGRLAFESEEVGLLDVTGDTRSLEREGLRTGYITGRFSSDGESLALVRPDDVKVVAIDQPSGLVEYGSDPGLPYQVVWSSDSRYLVYPGQGGIVVADMVDFGVDLLVTERSFTGVGVIPGSGP